MQLDLKDRRTQLGVGLVALGLLALLSNLGLFSGLGRLVGLALFGVAGVLVLGLYRSDTSKLWALPVGFGLLGLAVATLELPWSGGAFLGAIGLGFLAIYLTDAARERWWAIIPAGALLTLGLVAMWDETFAGRGDTGGAIFFLGLAATFAALYLIPSIQKRWAIWPALGLGVIAILTMSFNDGWIAPIVLIALGAWMLTRQSRPSDVRPTPPAPSTPSEPTPPEPVTPLSPMPVPESVPTPAATEASTTADAPAPTDDVATGDVDTDEDEPRT